MEDDAYYYLQYGEGAGGAAGPGGAGLAGLPGLRLPQSYLGLDNGPRPRVIRLDTASKTLAPGFRIGWMQPWADTCHSTVQSDPNASTWPQCLFAGVPSLRPDEGAHPSGPTSGPTSGRRGNHQCRPIG